MSVSQLQQVFLWCTVINYCLLILWWVILRLPQKWIYNLSCGPLQVSEAQFDSYNLTGIIIYKLSIVMLFLVPYIALRIVG